MKPDWDKLMNAYAGDKTVLVADVDCTAGGKSKCMEVGVKGYPTIKYGPPNALQDYKGGRDFASLKKFVEGLGPACGPANPELCDEEKRQQMSVFMALTTAEIEEMITSKDAEIEKIEKEYRTIGIELHQKEREARSKMEKGVEAVKATGLDVLKMVLDYKMKSASEL
mmetsp:Transcript_36068/g.90698  ORF Transcript_36068/g.90698 Transcript_36068/m.90698 type:complete len:168 (-) Transcript_36068:51-554(-)